jgi:hypothetical protein
MEPVTYADGSDRAPGAFRRPSTPAQWFAALGGTFLVVLGILALVLEPVRFGAAGPVAHEPDLVIWSVNGWTAAFWLAMGVIGILSVPRFDAARDYARFVGVLFGLVAIWGFVDGNDVAGILAADTTDDITHAVLGALGLLAAAFSWPHSREDSVASLRDRDRDLCGRRRPGALGHR